MRDSDFDGITDFSGHSGLEDMRLAESLFTKIERGERPTSGEMLFLRWFSGLSLEPPKNYRQIEMAVFED